MMEFHILTPSGQVHLFSVDAGRVVPAGPEPDETLASGRPCTAPVSSSAALLEDHATHDAE